ncbi:MAG: TonB-dependent receptor [Hellea sp.]|nr:TonB-dependent receptor [Hellea sp.]
MTKLSLKTVLGMTASVAMLSAYNMAPAYAQSAEDAVVEDEIITLGTRRAARSAQDLVAPVDIISGVELTNQASSDALDILRTSVPSFNVNTQPISDAATIIRPPNLRGLSPDNTLVLLNGKRRHKGSVISFLGGGIADGAQGVDLSVFPALALKNVQVLRDGASSQYGSDAIAGVINFTLKDDASGGMVEAKYGSTYEGDGDNYSVAGNIGFGLGDDGFVNITAEYSETDGTVRATDRSDVQALIAAGVLTGNENLTINSYTDQYAQYWGQPDVTDNIKVFVNSGVDLSENVELYAFGNYAERTAEGGFFFRNPNTRGGVYAGPTVDPTTGNADPNGVASVLVGAIDGNTAACPAGIPLLNGAPDVNSVPYQTVFNTENCFSFIETIPTGFVPRFGGDNKDMSVTGGLRGEVDLGNGLGYDLSATHGSSDTEFFINNTVNASLGPNTPRSFTPGAYKQTETVLNADFTYGVPVEGFASDLSVGFGGEWREETFDITAGDPASFALGPLSTQGFSSSSNGFGGFANDNTATQDSYAAYVDLEAEVTDALTLQGALRYEDYTAFGDTLDYKIGAKFDITDSFLVRGTYSTGFHAPSAGQATVTNVTTQIVNGSLIDQGTLPLSSNPGQLAADFIENQFGERPELGTEEARNIAAGVAFDTGPMQWTVDYFNIEVKNRIALSANVAFLDALDFAATQAGLTLPAGSTVSSALDFLANNNVITRSDYVGFEDLTEFRYFTNSFDTKTQGIDVVGRMPFDIGSGDSTFIIGANYTDTNVTNTGTVNPISASRVRALEDLLPNVKGFATVTHEEGKFRGLLRANYFGGWYDNGNDYDVGSEVLFDAELGYEAMEGLELIVGAANVFDAYPDENPGQTGTGQLYPEASPIGFSGGQYYVKARYTFD